MTAWAAALGACSPPSTTQEEGKPAPRAVAPEELEAASCRASSDAGAWARFAGAACDWELLDDGDGLQLTSLSITSPRAARGEVPPPCREATCVYHGVLDAVGPLVLAVVPAFDSEMPSDVLLGFVDGERLVFTSLWEGAGEPVRSDYTRVGPAHALAPFACGEALALLAVPRLDVVGAAVPDTLAAREGRIDPADPSTPAGPVERAGCRAVDLPVP